MLDSVLIVLSSRLGRFRPAGASPSARLAGTYRPDAADSSVRPDSAVRAAAMTGGPDSGRYGQTAGTGRPGERTWRTWREQQRGLRPADRPVPAGTVRALLPDARLGPGRRGPGPGDPAAGLAGLRPLRREPRVA